MENPMLYLFADLHISPNLFSIFPTNNTFLFLLFTLNSFDFNSSF